MTISGTDLRGVEVAEKFRRSEVIKSARLSVAPMMDWTDRHCRYLHRLLSSRVLLYTEMVTSPALVRGGALHLLDHHADEHPVALQLGGSDPVELAQAARIGAAAGYDEINLNVGCPSDRVQSGTFGAVLMRQPALVATCVRAMQDAVDIEVTVKCRIGVDDQNPAEVMKGLFPNLHISVNGGITSLDQAVGFLEAGLDGVMVGRAAYHQPSDILSTADRRIYGVGQDTTAEQAVHGMLPYIEAHLSNGGRLHQVTRHMLGLFAGRPGARGWRRALSEGAHRDGAGPDLVEQALTHITQAPQAQSA